MLSLCCPHPPTSSHAQFARCGKYLLSGGRDSIVRLWDLRTGRVLVNYEGGVQTATRTQSVFSHTEVYIYMCVCSYAVTVHVSLVAPSAHKWLCLVWPDTTGFCAQHKRAADVRVCVGCPHRRAGQDTPRPRWPHQVPCNSLLLSFFLPFLASLAACCPDIAGAWTTLLLRAWWLPAAMISACASSACCLSSTSAMAGPLVHSGILQHYRAQCSGWVTTAGTARVFEVQVVITLLLQYLFSPRLHSQPVIKNSV